MSATPTPRTDEKSFFEGSFAHPQNNEYVPAAFARELETELAAVQAERERLSEQLSIDSYVITEKNQTIVELQAERGRLREALEKINAIEYSYEGGDWDEIDEAQEIAQKALEESK